MLPVPASPVPSISISFAPHELPPVEPKSPFCVTLPEVPDSPRPVHLSPPPTLSPGQVRRAQRYGQLSPLSPQSPSGGQGLERAKFEAMLKASRERSALVGAKKDVDLRREIAVKFQKVKQFERRALFLSKLVAPPSPTAASQPVTPPDSPAVFHFTLPSPGLVSPLELFEDLANHPELYESKVRIEQVDFRLPHQKLAAQAFERPRTVAMTAKPKSLPSLDEISQRLGQNSSLVTARSPSPERGSVTSSRLPSFLRSRSPCPSTVESRTPVPAPTPANNQTRARPRLPPILATAPKNPGLHVRTPTPITTTKNIVFPPLPPSPKSPRAEKLQITTTICPLTKSKASPTEFTEENISRFGTLHTIALDPPTDVANSSVDMQVPNRRAEATKAMFNKLSRRTPGLPGAAACGIKAQDDTSPVLAPNTEDKLRRRISAPAELCARRGVQHPILAKPGGF